MSHENHPRHHHHPSSGPSTAARPSRRQSVASSRPAPMESKKLQKTKKGKDDGGPNHEQQKSTKWFENLSSHSKQDIKTAVDVMEGIAQLTTNLSEEAQNQPKPSTDENDSKEIVEEESDQHQPHPQEENSMSEVFFSSHNDNDKKKQKQKKEQPQRLSGNVVELLEHVKAINPKLHGWSPHTRAIVVGNKKGDGKQEEELCARATRRQTVASLLDNKIQFSELNKVAGAPQPSTKNGADN